MDFALAVAISFLSFSAPLTAAIYVKARKNNGNGYSTRELAKMDAKLDGLCEDIREVKSEVSKIWAVISP